MTAPGATPLELLDHWAATRPASRFCGMDGHAWTFAEMRNRSLALAGGLASLGVAPGERVATLAPNRPELLELLFAVPRADAIQVPLNAFLKGSFLEHQLNRAAARTLITDSEGLTALEPMAERLGHLETVLLLDGEREHALGNVRVVPWAQLRDAPAGSGAAPTPQSTMSIMFTSGTTGLPKGCVLSHGYYVRCGAVVAQAFGTADGDGIYAALPLFHAGGRLLAVMTALTRGIPVTVDSAFSPTRFFPRAAEVDATIAMGVGAMGQALLATPPADADRQHRVRTMLVAPMTPDAQARFAERYGADPWTEFYGQTECVPLTYTPAADTRDRAGCGHPAADVEVALLNDQGHPVADGNVGEICIRPREPFAMFDGYWDDAESTLKALRGLWYHTGDLGRMRPSGELEFVDRKKDAMRRRGENVSSLELEAVIMTLPYIAEAAVHAVPSDATEDDIKACVVLAAGVETTPEQLFEDLAAALPYFAMPRYVERVEELPKNAVGRVMKHLLRERGAGDGSWDFDALGLRIAREDRRGSAAGARAD